MRGAVITPDGCISFCDFADYRDLQKAVGGDVNLFPHPDGYDAPVVTYVNDTGKLDGLRCNHGALALMTQEFCYRDDDMPVGNVVILGANEGSLTAKQEDIIRNFNIKLFGSMDYAFIISALTAPID